MLLTCELMLGIYNIILSLMDPWLHLDLSDVKKADALLSRSYLQYLAPVWWYDRETLLEAIAETLC